MILVIDNYDSFTYNLVQILGELGCSMHVVRNDRVTLSEIANLPVTHIVISPGPGTPDRAGVSEDVICHFGPTIPVLGVCLGHQAIGEVFGGRVVRARAIRHGKTSTIAHDGQGLYRGLPQSFIATRYHSLALDEASLPECLSITSWSEDGEIMGVRHREYPIEGVQFHPESVLTDVGRSLLSNFVGVSGGAQA